MSREVKVVTHYLQMKCRDERIPCRRTAPAHWLERAEIASPELSRFLYTAVGGDWYWTDRLSWSHDQWLRHLARPSCETWVAYRFGTPVGYYELDQQRDGAIEVASFGLLPSFIGCGLGGAVLDAAVVRAWALQPTRVWVHTCTLDHPNALQNYLARGFQIYDRKVAMQTLPDEPPGPWPGAQRRASPR